MKLDALLSGEHGQVDDPADWELLALMLATPSMREEFERGTPLSVDEIIELNRP